MAVEPGSFFNAAPSKGVCEVVLYTDDHHATFADLSPERVEDVIAVWQERTAALGSLHDIQYVFIFENKGEAVGVTLHHPHGQIYAYSFVPPIIATECAQLAGYRNDTGRCLLCDSLREELKNAERVVFENDSFVAYVPFAARWPYEVHVVGKRHFGALPELSAAERRDLAAMLLELTAAYDALFSRSFPYVMALHQAPAKELDELSHFHIEFYPPMRSESRLKYLAGSEIGAGMFINDTLPEETAQRLRDARKA